jgi:PST family polysaccharide transporter
MALRVIAWPMGFIILAKGAQRIFFWTELAATVVHVGLAFALVKVFGVTGATMAFFGLYVWHGILIYAIVRRYTGFRWSKQNIRTARLYLPMIAIVFCACEWLPTWFATILGVAVFVASGAYSLRTICQLLDLAQIPPVVRDVLARIRMIPCEQPSSAV